MEKLVGSGLNVVCLMRYGSHLYGTNTPESDTDYKGVFMPTPEQIYLQKVPKSVRFDTNNTNGKNSAEDIDAEFYSFHYFVEMACKGETCALDMLHVNKENLLRSSALWHKLVNQRSKFYTKNLKAFVGYARKQAAKYGLKGSRLNAAQQVYDYLDKFKAELRLEAVWEGLPQNDHCSYLPDSNSGLLLYQMCGKQFQSSAKVGYAKTIVEQFVDQYGERARMAQLNEGVDWKAMSHAIRAAYEVQSLLTIGDLEFPLKCADMLVEVKTGKCDFEKVLSTLERLMDSVESLSKSSVLPERVNQKYWDDFVVNEVKNYLGGNHVVFQKA